MASSKLDIIIQAQDQASKVLSSLVSRTNDLQSSVANLGSTNSRTETQTSGMTAAFFKAGIALEAVKFAANLAGNAIRSIVDLGSDVLGSAAAYEQSAIAFRVMIGDAGKARTLLQDISKFAAQTPFDLPDVVEGSKRLLAYNFSAEKIIPTFRMLGDVAAGVGRDKLPFLITALGQVQAKTKLSGEELRQFTETGVPLVEELARVTGYSAAQIVGDTANLNISFDQVEQAFRNMTSEGGKFYGLMEAQSKTYSGTITNLRDNFMSMGMEIIGISTDGTIREGSLFQSLTNSATNLLGWIGKNREAIEEFGRKVLDRVVNVIKNDVIPWMEKWGNKIIEYISSPTFKKDMDDWVNKMAAFGRAISGAVDMVDSLFDRMESSRKTSLKILEVFEKLGNITPGGFLGNLFRTGTIPGLKAITDLAHNLHIPGFAQGTSFAPGGLAVVGERGPELVNLPRGSQVFSNSESRQMSGSTSPTINIGTVINNTQADLTSLARDIGFNIALRT